jgi:hypothetical protein
MPATFAITPTLPQDLPPTDNAPPPQIRHIQLGPPTAVQLTIHRLHRLGYAEAIHWTQLLALPDNQLILRAAPEDVISLLRQRA